MQDERGSGMIATMQAPPARLDGLQVLRALAALAVVVFHCHWTGIASFGVELFFVISGFVICHAAAQNPQRFLAKRVARVVPLYWLATLGVFAIALIAPAQVSATHPTMANLLRSLLFWPFVREDGADMPLLFLGWTLNYEAFFYGVFALCLAVSARLAPWLALCLLIAIAALHPLAVPLGDPLDFWTRPIVLNFACGIVAWLVWRGQSVAAWRIPAIIAAPVAMIGLGVLMTGVHHRLGAIMPWSGIISGVLLLAVLALGPRLRWPGGLLLVGDASYSLYLLHPYVLEVINRKLHPFGPDPLGILASLVAVLAAVGLALGVFRLIERPGNRALRRLIG
jgi:peptidoglycan/LPS O-acetylase OafA/YrhL